ncbi:hypothetical protein GQR58_019031 [Nymphon striatum]|nr:hypothetical protein GQR58_019031 [Nymphon striatum]
MNVITKYSYPGIFPKKISAYYPSAAKHETEYIAYLEKVKKKEIKHKKKTELLSIESIVRKQNPQLPANVIFADELTEEEKHFKMKSNLDFNITDKNQKTVLHHLLSHFEFGSFDNLRMLQFLMCNGLKFEYEDYFPYLENGAVKIKKFLETIFEVDSSITKASKKQSTNYNVRNKVADASFMVGETVYWKRPPPAVTGSKKLLPVWQGPFTICGQLGPKTYIIEGDNGIKTTVNIDQLKKSQLPILLKFTSGPNAYNKEGRTPMLCAIANHYSIKELIEGGADINFPSLAEVPSFAREKTHQTSKHIFNKNFFICQEYLPDQGKFLQISFEVLLDTLYIYVFSSFNDINIVKLLLNKNHETEYIAYLEKVKKKEIKHKKKTELLSIESIVRKQNPQLPANVIFADELTEEEKHFKMKSNLDFNITDKNQKTVLHHLLSHFEFGSFDNLRMLQFLMCNGLKFEYEDYFPYLENGAVKIKKFLETIFEVDSSITKVTYFLLSY